MKPSASRIERMLAEVEAALVPPPRKWLQVIIHEGEDDEAEAKAKALAEHVARHPEDVGRTVEDFDWIQWVIVHPKFIIGADGRVRWPETIEGEFEDTDKDTDKDTDASETLSLRLWPSEHRRADLGCAGWTASRRRLCQGVLGEG
jgi:hypothetical protein